MGWCTVTELGEETLRLLLRAQAAYAIDRVDPDNEALHDAVRRLGSQLSVQAAVNTLVFCATWYPPDEIDTDNLLKAHNGIVPYICKTTDIPEDFIFYHACTNRRLPAALIAAVNRILGPS